MGSTEPSATPTDSPYPVVPLRGSGPQRRPGKPAAPPGALLDWVMLLLAIGSVVLLVWITFWEVDPDVERRVVRLDYAICAIFASRPELPLTRSDVSTSAESSVVSDALMAITPDPKYIPEHKQAIEKSKKLLARLESDRR